MNAYRDLIRVAPKSPVAHMRLGQLLFDSGDYDSAAKSFDQAVALDPKLRVLIVHGYNDLSCPYFASLLIVDQIPVMGDPSRVRVAAYPGGHMFYSRPDSGAAFRRDVVALYGAR